MTVPPHCASNVRYVYCTDAGQHLNEVTHCFTIVVIAYLVGSRNVDDVKNFGISRVFSTKIKQSDLCCVMPFQSISGLWKVIERLTRISTNAEIARHPSRWTQRLLLPKSKTPHFLTPRCSLSVEFRITGYYMIRVGFGVQAALGYLSCAHFHFLLRE